MPKKKCKLVAYSIKTSEVTTREERIVQEVNAAMKSKPTIADRFMKINSQDTDSDVDFISYIRKAKQGIFGFIIRMKSGVASQISIAQLSGSSLSLEEIEQETKENVVGTIKDYSYFYLTKDLLIYTSGGPRIKSFQGYLNWILTETNQPLQYVFAPIIQSNPETPLSAVSSIDISDSFFVGKKRYDNYSQTISDISRTILSQILKDQKTLKELESENIISARILLTIKRGRKKDEEKKEVLQALVKSVETDDIVIRTRDGRTIKGSDFESKKVVTVDTTPGGYPAEMQLETEMCEYAKELLDAEAGIK